MPPSIIYQKRVEFSETDMAGIVHFTNYFKWMEAAEAALFESLDVPLIEKDGGILTGWPRVRVKADFQKPLFFRDLVEVRLAVVEVKIRAVEYACRFYRVDEGEEPQCVASGAMTTVFARMDDNGEMESVQIPPALTEALEKLASVS